MSKLIHKHGFTLIELSLAVAFLSMLMLIMISTTDGIMSTYSRGLSMKKINAVGRDLVDEFTDTVNNSEAIDPKIICSEYYNKNDPDLEDDYKHCIDDEAYKFTYQQHVFESIISYGDTINNAPAYGMFCTGSYSYIWNTGYTFENETFLTGAGDTIPRVSLRYYVTSGDALNGRDTTTSTFRILKVYDTGRLVCANQLFDGYPEGDSLVIRDTDYEETHDPVTGVSTGTVINIDITKDRHDNPTNLRNTAPEELLTSSEIGGLALYQFVIYPPASDLYSGNRFYVGSFVLGTLNSGVSINPAGDSCAAPPGLNFDSDYCALNKFNFAIRATGGK